MMVPRVPLVNCIRQFHQSQAWTLASLASARPKWKTKEVDELTDEDEEHCSAKNHGKPKYEYNEAMLKNQPLNPSVMGAFSSLPSFPTSCNDEAEDLCFPPSSAAELLARCKSELQDLPTPYKRKMNRRGNRKQEDAECDDCSVRILQWNILAQALGTGVDNFVRCDPTALHWANRRWRIIEEIVQHSPTVICLQEVDNFDILSRALGSIGYQGRFLAKPDSACVYQEHNTGPDGCAIFYQDSIFSCTQVRTKVLEVWGAKTNQVVLMISLTHKQSRKDVCIATTHLKARRGDLLSSIRNEQGKDVLQFLKEINTDIPIILTGDFNDEPCEAVYETITGNERTPLVSAYKIKEDKNEEDESEDDILEYTTWKIRDTGEEKKVHDYIFHSPQLKTFSTLDMPTEDQVGEDRLPSLQFPSDHLSLVVDIRI